MNYLMSVLVTLLVNLSTNTILKKRLKERGYLEKMVKTSHFSLSNLISLLLIIVPKLNLVVSAITAFMTYKALKDDDVLLAMYKNRHYSSYTVKRAYERDNVKESVLRDALTLDGASEEIISEELKKVELQKKGVEEADFSRGFYTPVPDFSDEEYMWACAEEKAKSLVEAISLENTLTEQDKEHLLNLFRKECLSESKGQESDGEVVMKKVLKVTNKNQK